MDSQENKIDLLIEKIRTGEIYGEIQIQLEENLRKRRSNSRLRKDVDIDELQEKIIRKETEITKLLGDIIRLKNELSFALEKELE
jgi:hypothetical protein